MNLEYTHAPHRGRNDVAVQHNAALLIDFDNVTMGIRSNLGQELRNLLDSEVIRGKVAVQRAYADWRRYPQYIVPLSESSIDLIFAPAYGSSKKNATDIRLAIDALELVFTRPEIGMFILLSGDSDFSSLVLKLKEYGKYVIGVGLQESTSDILVQNCDEYYSYNRLSGLMSADEVGAEKHDPWTLVGRAVTRMAERDDVMRSDRLKQVMLEIDPSFDEKTAGFNKFNRFLAEAAGRDLVRLRKGENGQYVVAPGDAAGDLDGVGTVTREEPPRPQSRSRRGRRGGSRSGSGRASSGSGGGRGSRSEGRSERTPPAEPPASEEPEPEVAASSSDDGFEGDVPAVALRKAYEELATVVDLLYDGEPIRDSMAKRKLLERDETFDEGSLGFRKFSRFLRQANDEGIVDLTQGDEGNYYLRPVRGADAHPSRTGDGDREQRGRSRRGGGRSRGGREDRTSEPSKAAMPDSVEIDDSAAVEAEEPTADSGAASGASASESALSAARAAAKRTLGRFRRGSKSASASGRDSTAPRIGPVDGSPDGIEEEAPAGADASGPASYDGPTSAEEDRSPVATQWASPEAPSVERATPAERATPGDESTPGDEATSERPPDTRARGVGRFRSGSRGRSSTPKTGSSSIGRIGPVSTPNGPETRTGPDALEARAEPAPSAAPAPDSPATQGEDREVVDHMVRNYPGVGKRTAEALVDRFGPEVFEVIDREPDRLTEAISEGRAKAVIEARREERED